MFVKRFFGFVDEWIKDVEVEEISGRPWLPEDMGVAAEAKLAADDGFRVCRGAC